MESQHEAIARAYGDASAEIGSTDEAVLNARVLALLSFSCSILSFHRCGCISWRWQWPEHIPPCLQSIKEVVAALSGRGFVHPNLLVLAVHKVRSLTLFYHRSTSPAHKSCCHYAEAVRGPLLT